MAEKHIMLDVDGRGVGTVTLNRPEKHNAFDEHAIAALAGTFNELAGNSEVRVVVLRASGANFCAGADVAWMKRTAAFDQRDNLRDARSFAAMLQSLNSLPQPTIARVQGAAMGGGAGLVCCCDIAVAAMDAKFAFSEVKLGLIPAVISPYVIHAMGSRAARRYFLTGERFSAQQAQQLGMVSDVVEGSALDETVAKLVAAILENGPQAVRAAKQLIFDVEGQAITEELARMTSERIAGSRASSEGKEGLAAFLEKRRPDWS